MACDFGAFAQAGRDLVELHLGYETCAEYPLRVAPTKLLGLKAEHFRIGTKKMRFADKEDRSVLILNDFVRLAGIPPEAHEYVVNGRSPIEWFMDRYRITRDNRSGILNDPNGWFEKPEDLVTAFKRIVHVSVETVKIVRGLPEPFPEEDKNRDATQT